MDKRLREISRFFVAPPRVFPLSVCARARESTPIFIQKCLQLSRFRGFFLDMYFFTHLYHKDTSSQPCPCHSWLYYNLWVMFSSSVLTWFPCHSQGTAKVRLIRRRGNHICMMKNWKTSGLHGKPLQFSSLYGANSFDLFQRKIGLVHCYL